VCRKRGDAALARQVIAQYRETSDLLRPITHPKP
jgi:hypothetical protein